MIERLQKISTELFKNALKTYTPKEVLTHKRAHAHNIPEMLSLFPNKGVGFKVMRKHWQSSQYFTIKRASYKSHRFGSFYGHKYRNNKTENEYPVRLSGLSKRGIWTFDLGQFQQFTTDNGIKYTRKDYEAFLISRKIAQTQEQNPPRKAQQGKDSKDD